VRGIDPVSSRRRAFAARRRAVHRLALLLARHAALIAWARGLTARRAGRLARIAALLDFVHRLAAADARLLPARPVAGLPAGDLAVAVLTALLRASGERASIEYMRETAFVRVAVARDDVRRLPPWARLLRSHAGTVDLALAPSASWRPAGYLGPDVRAALERRGARLLARAS
jgi:hypothetical protein